MSHTVTLMLRYARGAANLTNCINFRLKKERYTPYTELHGRWYCPAATQINEILGVMLNIDGTVKHYGYPTGISFEKKDGRLFIDISSLGYTAALETNQCPDGLLTDINLTSLTSAAATVPNVVYQPDTPTVTYVNYYDGTSLWSSIVCYSIRASGYYPYIYGYNTVRISPHENRAEYSADLSQMISYSDGTDYSKIISCINEKDVDGTPNAFSLTNSAAAVRAIVRNKEINFDREWIMDPEKGLQYKIGYSMRGYYTRRFTLPGLLNLDLLDGFSVPDLRLNSEVDALIISGSATGGFITEVRCYVDSFCPGKKI